MTDQFPLPDTPFKARYKRLFEAAECRTQIELAHVLGIRQSSVSDAKRRQSIPSDWLVTLFEKKRINPEWVRMGVGAMCLNPDDAKETLPHVVRVVEIRPPAECSMQELFTELVRRSLKPLDITAMQKEAAESWLPLVPLSGKPGDEE